MVPSASGATRAGWPLRTRTPRPEQPSDVERLGGISVKAIVVEEWGAEHLQLRRVPAAHDVEREASPRDVVDRRGLFRGHDWVDHWHVRGGEDRGMLRDRGHP